MNEETDISKTLAWKPESVYLSHKDKHWKHFNGRVPYCAATTCCTNSCSVAPAGEGGLANPPRAGQPWPSCLPLEVLNKSPCHAHKVELSSKAKAWACKPIGKSRDIKRRGQYFPFLSHSNTRVWLQTTLEPFWGPNMEALHSSCCWRRFLASFLCQMEVLIQILSDN